MPAVNQGKVLVTGANGYIAVWVVKYLLDQGFSVRGTVRKESYIPYLKDLFKDSADRIEFVVVPDITKVWPSSILSLSRRLSLTILDISSGTRIR